LRTTAAAGPATTAELEAFDQLTAEQAQRILNADAYELFEVTEITDAVPQTSTVDLWVTCAVCNEQVMDTRTRRSGGQTVCIPCAEAARAAA
jgi:formylmethanofuran dehydrogenase subunit E